MSPPGPSPIVPDRLTPREVQVLRSVAAGSTNKETAAELALAISTVEGHLVHGRGDDPATGVPGRGDPADVVDQFHDHSAVHVAVQVAFGMNVPPVTVPWR